MGDSSPHFRRGGRRALALHVRFRPHDAVYDQRGTTRDIATEGAFIETDRPPPVGTRLVVILTSPTAWDPIELSGEVRRVGDGSDEQPPGFAVAFDPVPGPVATALYELIHSAKFTESGE